MLDPTIFAYRFFKDDRGNPLKVYPHQDLILNDPSKQILLNIARQTGKSTAAAIKAIHTAYWNTNALIIIMSATKPQALEVVRKIKTYLLTSDVSFKTLMPRNKENKAEGELKNPGAKTISRIISVPATDGARGYSPDLVICDDMAFWEDADTIFNQVVQPMVDATGGSILALSTPNGRHGPHWNCYNSKHWSAYHFDWHANPLNTQERMDMKKDTMTTLQFKAEYEADFVSSQSSYFTMNEVTQSIHVDAGSGWKGEKNICVGVDFGKLHDKCVIDIGTIMNVSEPKNKHIIRLLDHRVKPLGTSYASVINELKSINSSLRPNIFMLDATGVGEGPFDVLRADGVPVEAFKFSLFSKITIMNNLKILMQQHRVQIPDEKEILSQLEMFEYEASEKGGVAQPKLHAPEGKHDDEVDALALMSYGLTTSLGMISSEFIEQGSAISSTVPDVIKKSVIQNNSFEKFLEMNQA